MSVIINVAIYGVVLLCILFLADAIVGFVRAARGRDEDVIARRLLQAPAVMLPVTGETVPLLRPAVNAGASWTRYLPVPGGLETLVRQSGLAISGKRLVTIMAIAAVTVFALFAFILPGTLLLVAVGMALLSALMPIFYLMRARSARRKKFEEQLPDALDLIVRSLKVGHPLSGAMSVIAEEMPAPIGTEFRIATDAVSYGEDLTTAFIKMSERMPVLDLGYLIVAIQIQQETGGNLVESLSKLSTIIRERFRMFRKVKAMTAEGRFSAWLLSIFPLVIAGGIELVRPGYYAQVADYPYFPHLVVLTFVLLVVNIFVMRMMTAIKV
jgi:tight adherence protein B